MAGDKYRSRDGNKDVLKQARQAGGSGFGGNLVALNDEGFLSQELLDENARSYRIIETTLPFGTNVFVNFYDDDGSLAVRLADASIGREAHGFTVEGKGSGAGPLTVYFNGTFTGLPTMTIGAEQFLYSDGAWVEAPTEEAGHIFQSVGFAIDATTLRFIRSAADPVLAS